MVVIATQAQATTDYAVDVLTYAKAAIAHIADALAYAVDKSELITVVASHIEDSAAHMSPFKSRTIVL